MIDLQQKRIEWICEFLDEPRSFNAIRDYLKMKVDSLKYNQAIKNKGLSKRTFEADRQKIKLGNFMFINKIDKSTKGKVVFDLKYSRRTNKYYFTDETERPLFEANPENERLTMPFIAGILEPYKNIVGINKIIDSFKSTYDLNNKLLFNKAIVTSIVRNKELKKTHKALQTKVEELLSVISNKKVITLMYSNVSILIPAVSSSKKYVLFPYQVRIHDGLYYLIARDLVEHKVKNFRIDHIKSQIATLAIDDEENDDEEQAAMRIYGLQLNSMVLQEDFFKYSFGVWCHNYPRIVYQLTIAFFDWAASYILINPIHSTQNIESITADEVTISILLNLQAEPELPYNVELISKELAFALGKFRTSCEIKSIIKVKEEKIIRHYL